MAEAQKFNFRTAEIKDFKEKYVEDVVQDAQERTCRICLQNSHHSFFLLIDERLQTDIKNLLGFEVGLTCKY